MARRFTRAQSLRNRAFLDALARTGNARLAARELGVHRATYTKRRAKCAAFAQDWEAALAAAHARFKLGGGPRPPEAEVRAETRRRGEANSGPTSGRFMQSGQEGRRAKLANGSPRQEDPASATRAGSPTRA